MKSFLFSALFSFLSLSMFSQAYDVEWSSTITNPGGLFAPFYLLNVQPDNYQFFMETKKDHNIFTHDFNHQFIDSQNADFKFNGKEVKLNKLIHTQTKTFAILHTAETKDPIWRLYHSELEKNEYKKPQLTYNKTLASTAFSRKNFKNFFPNILQRNIILSPDSSKILLVNRPNNFEIEKKDDIQFDLVVFDSNMDVLWNKDQQLNYPNKQISFLESLVDNNGTVFILASIDKKDEEDYNIHDRYDYKIIKITENNIDFFSLKLEDDDLKPFRFLLLLPQNEEDICSVIGLYKAKDKTKYTKGIFSFRVNKQSSKGVSRLFPIEDIISDSIKESYFVKNNKGLASHFKCDNFFSLKNGIYGCGIEYRADVSSYTSSSSPANSSYTNYISRLLLVPYFNENGELINTTIIDKYFSYTSTKYTSYSMNIANNNIYLLYNDHFKTSADIPENGTLLLRKDYYAKMVVLNDKGDKVVQKTLFDAREKNLLFVPKETIHSNSHLVIMARKKKKYAFGVINLK